MQASSVREHRFAKLQEARDALVVERNVYCQERSRFWSDAGLVSVYKHPREITLLECKIKEIDRIARVLYQ